MDFPTWDDAIVDADTETFVGRTAQLTLFRDELARVPPRRLVFFISGQGGVGKSALLNQFRKLAASSFDFLVAVVDETQTDIASSLGRLAEQLKQSGVRLPTFSERYTTYRQRREEIEADPNAPEGIVALVARTVVRTGLALGDAVPVVRRGLDVIDADALSTQAGAWATYLAKRLTNKDEISLLRDPVPILTDLFIRDLNALRQPVLLCFENYEHTRSYLDDWILRIREHKPAQTLRIAIASRTVPGAHWDTLRNVVAHIPLDVFTVEEAEAFLDAVGIHSSKRRKEVLESSERLPVMMSWLASADAEEPDPNIPTTDIVNRFLRWVADPVLRRGALRAAIPRHFDLDVLTLLTDRSRGDVASTELPWLQQRPFVTEHHDGWRYHDVVRRYLLRYQKQESLSDYRKLHLRLADHFQNAISELKLDARARWRNREWRQAAFEWTYHYLAGDPERHWLEILNLFILSLVNRRSFARELASLLASQHLRDDLSATQSRDAELFAAQLQQAQGHGPRVTLRMFDRLCEISGLSGDARLHALVFRGDARRLNGMRDEALADFNAVIAKNPEHPEALLARGQTFRELKRYKEAAADFARTREVNPGLEHMVQTELGLLYQATGDYEAAIRAFRLALADNSECPTCWEHLANSYAKISAPGDLHQLLQQAVSIPPDHIPATVMRAMALLEVNCPDAALMEFDSVLARDGKDATAMFGRARALRRLGRSDDAIQTFRLAMELDAGFEHEGSKEIGLAYQEQGRHEQAVEAFKIAINTSPSCSRSWEGITRSYQQTVSPQTIAPLLRDILSTEPTDATAFACRARALYLSGNLQSALVDANKAVTLDPYFSYALSTRARIFVALERDSDAVKDLTRALELRPDSAFLLDLRTHAHFRLGNFEQAEKDIAELERIQGLDGDTMNLRGLLYSYKLELDAAIECFRRVLQKEPKHFSAAYNLAISLSRAAGLSAATSAIKEAEALLALAAGPGLKEYGSGGLLAIQGKTADALTMLRAAVEADGSVKRWAASDIAWLDLRGDATFIKLMEME